MKTLLKNLLCSTLVICSLASACMIPAAEAPDQYSTDTNTEISPRSSIITLDVSITRSSYSWFQQGGYTAYRIWVDNTTGALMTVTITSPSGQTKNVYITSGSNKTYTNNDAEAGTYHISLHTYADALSGTLRVRASTMPL